MTDHIEDGFEPQTVNEVLLLNRIKALKLAAFANNFSTDPIRYSTADKPMEITGPFQPQLILAAELRAGWEKDCRFGIHAIAHGNRGSINLGYYMSQDSMTRWTVQARAQRLGEMHKDVIERLARSVEQWEQGR